MLQLLAQDPAIVDAGRTIVSEFKMAGLGLVAVVVVIAVVVWAVVTLYRVVWAPMSVTREAIAKADAENAAALARSAEANAEVAKTLAGMMGDMRVTLAEHRIASNRGRHGT